MRKTILVLCCALFLFALLFIGCGKQEEEPAELETPTEKMEVPAEKPVAVDTMMQHEEMMPDSAAMMDSVKAVGGEVGEKTGVKVDTKSGG
ncbi:MAG: hypothetical protein KKG33_06245 [candidate division Zixibacteria bacterium]|nr:hypothetical protein [candidate division Zixibacteria bacterium]MBU1471760.1 hypothetical protein [candidate division Zixibacteria bacterium]MBU2625142.1 hypothetical protein [candidate division Zixibacteria bacterium]